jgi:glucose/mannose transport system substrate-binding protein
MKRLCSVPLFCMTLFLALGPACPAPAAGDKRLEVCSWWTSGGEALALEALFKVYKYKNPGVAVSNAAIVGGGGSAARPVLQTRLAAGNPPDTWQVHPRHETLRPVRPGGLLRSSHRPLPE